MRIHWMSIFAFGLVLIALGDAAIEDGPDGTTIAMCAVALAVLSLRDR